MARVDPLATGTHTEAIILAALLERGYEVMVPFGNRAKYDFVVDDGARLQRVQCKTGHAGTTHNTLRFNTYCLSAAHEGRRRKCTYRSRVDLFAVYYPPNRAVYLIPVHDTPECGQCYLRLSPSKNGQTRGIRSAADYQLL
jgi:hypothetical protein